MKKLLLFLVTILLPEIVGATRAWVGPILYDFNMDTKEALVDSYSSALSGDVSIPFIISYGSVEYHVVGFKGSAFANCSNITSVTISEGIKTIDYRAFYNCNNLSSISIPYSCTVIGDEAFCDCANLKSVTIPEGVKSIGYRAYYGCTNLSNIIIPNSVTALGYDVFEGTKWYDNQPDGILYLDNCLIGYKGEKPIGELKIADGTRMLADNALLDCSEIISTFVPQSVIHIGSAAFSGCTSMMSVSLTEGLISIDYDAFSECKSLTTISIPNSVTNLSNAVFSGCSCLSSVNIGNGVKALNYKIFSGCSGLIEITIPNNVETIGNYAFEKCTGLKTIEIPNSVTSIDSHAFSGCSGLTSVTIGNNVTSIGDLAFGWCESLESISIPSSLTSMGDNVFYKCYRLSNVYISDIASWCKISFGNEGSFPLNSYKLYLNGTEVNNLEIPNNISSIPDYAFKNCSSIKSLTIPNNIIIINESSFQNCTQLETVKLPEELQIIKKAAFKECSSLKSVIIPSSVEFIYQEAFANCNSLEIVKAKPATPPFLYDNSFSNYSMPLEVPKGCKEEYQTAQVWKNFTNISESDKGYYKLIYLVDNEEYKTYKIEEGTSITPETEPTKEGYTFSGWSNLPETMPAKDVIVTGTFTVNKYKLTYTVDGEEYKSYDIEYGSTITSETEPTKEGYTFSGWSDLPETMPAKDVTVTGTFTVNKYKLTYSVDDEEYKSYDIEYGSTITSETEPTKEGYTFSGWSDLPETMPAKDVTVTGTFTVNKYKLTYSVDGEEYKSYDIEYGSTITSETEPTKEGYTFSGWSDLPETMPAKDVTVTGTFTINKYKVTYMIDGEVYQTVEVEYGSTITPPNPGDREGYDFAWGDYPSTMPAEDITINGSYTATDIRTILADESDVKIFNVSGKPLNNLQKGVNILRYKDGRTQKLIIK